LVLLIHVDRDPFSSGSRWNFVHEGQQITFRVQFVMLPVVIVGAGGHGQVVADALKACQHSVGGFVDENSALWGKLINEDPVLGGDEFLNTQPGSRLANGIGSIKWLDRRREVFLRLQSKGFYFVTIMHPRSITASNLKIDEGAQIMAGAILQSGTSVGQNTIVNTGAIVDHGCTIGPHCHIGPGSTISGDVYIGEGTHIGAGATIIQGRHIGLNVVVGAGAVVVDDIPDKQLVVGVPARALEG
jgi:sugar O-acyltransferase (sialic acid O-acetyltransferase NeuD family)